MTVSERLYDAFPGSRGGLRSGARGSDRVALQLSLSHCVVTPKRSANLQGILRKFSTQLHDPLSLRPTRCSYEWAFAAF